MHFRNALPEEAREVYALYQSVKGERFCVWNDIYPGMLEIRHDLETNNLYVLTENARIIGAISIVPENELDDFPCWGCADGTQREIARVVIARDCWGRGLSYEMVRRIEHVLRQNGCGAMHLSVVRDNPPAYRTYQKAGFTTVGEAEMYGHSYFLMEKTLNHWR